MRACARWMILAAACATFGAAASAAGAVTYVANCDVAGYLAYKPDYWSAGCTGGSPRIQPIRWRTWGSGLAIATGTAQLRGPCGDQPCYKADMYRAEGKLRLSRPRTCTSDAGATLRYFSRARWSIRYRKGNPFGEKPGWRTTTFTVPSNSGCGLAPG